ncbi:hypothetical protein HMPREF9946_02974 [Acetobacteraceae bacterium AT-5844]|nr:hypothetical protein HMPREF9946_02974 [Acetobacteraceae bacterium AT-5844]
MQNWRQYGPNLPPSTALLSLASAGLVLTTMPELLPGPLASVSVAAAGLACWLRMRRERKIARRLRDLRLSISLPVPTGSAADSALGFHEDGYGRWKAQRDGWQIHIHRDSSVELSWQLSLARQQDAIAPAPLAVAQSLDAVLSLARRLAAGMAAAGESSPLDCDLSFPVAGFSSAGEHRLTALAEGGYALRTGQGDVAVAAEHAEMLLCKSRAVRTAHY